MRWYEWGMIAAAAALFLWMWQERSVHYCPPAYVECDDGK